MLSIFLPFILMARKWYVSGSTNQKPAERFGGVICGCHLPVLHPYVLHCCIGYSPLYFCGEATMGKACIDFGGCGRCFLLWLSGAQ
jgi:hypothetical protein